ncbi:MAG: hypothetical protein P8N19_07200 [Flavobacteriales bacterium]|nr:hypothetical protein [Flavobacteriales bacterium]MDG1766767.1 hypothetical protein [Flavobacteriales bacterium]
MFKNINLRDALIEKRTSSDLQAAEEFVKDAFEILGDEVYKENQIKQAIKARNGEQPKVKWTNLNPTLVFSKNEIREMCLNYRLRFLDSRQFKGEIPEEGIRKIKEVQKTVGVELSNFMIAAPSERFVLEDCDKDPLLFIQLSDRYYYLVHQWGNDLAWWKPFTAFPLRNFYTLGGSIALLSLIIALIIPVDQIFNMANTSEQFARFAFFSWFMVCITAMVTYVGFAFFKNVSANEWDNPFFKQDF